MGLDSRTYVIKSRRFISEFPLVAPNELIGTHLARLLGLPAFEPFIVELEGELFFGTLLFEARHNKGIRRELLFACENVEQVHDLVVFDTWLCNADRLYENFLVEVIQSNPLARLRYRFWIIDQGQCFTHFAGSLDDLRPRLPSAVSDYVQLPCIKEAVRDWGKVETAITRVERLDPAVIQAVVRSAPPEWLSADDQTRCGGYHRHPLRGSRPTRREPPRLHDGCCW